MTKIPVGATIARTYKFVFGRFFTLLGIMWLPWVILIAAGLLFMRQSLAFSTAMTTQNYSAIGPFLMLFIPVYLVVLLLLLMQFMGIIEEALGLRKGSPYYYFSVGRTFWRLVASFLILIVLIVGVWLGLLAASFALGALGRLLFGGPSAATAVIVGILMPVFFGAYIYGMVRVSFLMMPVVVAENRIGVKRAWELGKGNFWRMFAILLAVVLPIAFLMVALAVSVLMRNMPPPPSAGSGAAQLAQYRAAVAAWQAAVTGRMMSYWYITYPVSIVLSVVFYGLGAACQAFAYRTLMPEDLSETFS